MLAEPSAGKAPGTPVPSHHLSKSSSRRPACCPSRALWCSPGSFGGAVLFTGQQPRLHQPKAKVLQSPVKAGDFALSVKGVIARLGSNPCSLEPVTAAVTKLFCIQSIRYLSSPLHQAGEVRGGSAGFSRGDNNSLLPLYSDLHLRQHFHTHYPRQQPCEVVSLSPWCS